MIDPRSLLRYFAYALVGCVAVAAALLAAALLFSVKVSGTSMEPTLHPGDRLVLDVFHRHDIHRFDLVVGHEPGKPGGASIVKRVVGMPGDRIMIEGGADPVVLIRPAGSAQTYAVDNPAWRGQVGMGRAACCQAGGVSVSAIGLPGHWVTVPPGSYWVIGDNWGGSQDSRVFGFLAATDIQSRVSFRVLPVSRIGSVPRDVRLVPHP